MCGAKVGAGVRSAQRERENVVDSERVIEPCAAAANPTGLLFGEHLPTEAQVVAVVAARRAGTTTTVAGVRLLLATWTGAAERDDLAVPADAAGLAH
jgi:hypothetical protein